MYFYTAFNLRLQSEIELPDLIPLGPIVAVDADLSIRFGPVDQPPGENDRTGAFSETNGAITLSLPKEGRFLFNKGEEIILDPRPELDPSSLNLFMLGAALNIALYQRGLWVFHASVVAISGKAVAFLGSQHAGKTTMAMALLGRGHQLLSDDLLALRKEDKRILAIPAFPRMKLWPDTAATLGVPIDGLPRVSTNTDKRTLSLKEGFCPEVFPLDRVYILETGEHIQIEKLPPKEAQLQLMTHWDLSKFGFRFLQGKRLAACFAQCGEIARQVPVCRLTREASLSSLSRLADMVEDDLDNDS